MQGNDPRSPRQRLAIRAVGLAWTALMVLPIWGIAVAPEAQQREVAQGSAGAILACAFYACFGLLLLTGARWIAGAGALWFGLLTIVLGAAHPSSRTFPSPWQQVVWTGVYFAFWVLLVWGRRLPVGMRPAPRATLPPAIVWFTRLLWLVPAWSAGLTVWLCLVNQSLAPLFAGSLATWVVLSTMRAYVRALAVPRPGAVGLTVVGSGLYAVGALCWGLYHVGGAIRLEPWDLAQLALATCAFMLLAKLLRDALHFDKRWQACYP